MRERRRNNPPLDGTGSKSHRTGLPDLPLSLTSIILTAKGGGRKMRRRRRKMRKREEEGGKRERDFKPLIKASWVPFLFPPSARTSYATPLLPPPSCHPPPPPSAVPREGIRASPSSSLLLPSPAAPPSGRGLLADAPSGPCAQPSNGVEAKVQRNCILNCAAPPVSSPSSSLPPLSFPCPISHAKRRPKKIPAMASRRRLRRRKSK
ncbi:hypothetical protein E2C01_082552 [Portunus trituberculatus]|uniref:Uncharacterized protein n=1 Tax=Portunus trituberculatus TaxID=210409 RepID=A0A5B7ISN2_PORTR|nr:hypothetical protein [Portunus trituberculatus]